MYANFTELKNFPNWYENIYIRVPYESIKTTIVFIAGLFVTD